MIVAIEPDISRCLQFHVFYLWNEVWLSVFLSGHFLLARLVASWCHLEMAALDWCEMVKSSSSIWHGGSHQGGTDFEGIFIACPWQAGADSCSWWSGSCGDISWGQSVGFHLSAHASHTHPDPCWLLQWWTHWYYSSNIKWGIRFCTEKAARRTLL